jgi:hypothetical protein
VDTAYYEGWLSVEYRGYLRGFTIVEIIVVGNIAGKMLVLNTTDPYSYYKDIMCWYYALASTP